VFAKSPAKLRERMPEILENAEEDLTPRMRNLLALLWNEWKARETRTGVAASNIFAAFSGDAGRPRSAAKAFAVPIGITPSAADVPTTLCSTS